MTSAAQRRASAGRVAACSAMGMSGKQSESLVGAMEGLFSLFSLFTETLQSLPEVWHDQCLKTGEAST